ncbi:MAG: putative motility protein [Spirochaetaceae bacterium]|nr:MAG: putative motility protein [Spirochaetaceae bacterium]
MNIAETSTHMSQAMVQGEAGMRVLNMALRSTEEAGEQVLQAVQAAGPAPQQIQPDHIGNIVDIEV